jgi:hypothetical protein
MPTHSSHILQPLDVGCFSTLKVSYGKHVEGKMRFGISHIDKEEFLQLYHVAHVEAMTEKNIQSGFAATALYRTIQIAFYLPLILSYKHLAPPLPGVSMRVENTKDSK